MPRIKVEFAKLQETGQRCADVSGKILQAKDDFQSTINQLDWEVRAKSDIARRARNVALKIENCRDALKGFSDFINDAYSKYTALEDNKKGIDDIGKMEPGNEPRKHDIFDGSNKYGGDQGNLANNKQRKHTHLGFFFNTEVYYEYDKDVYDFVRKQDGYEKYTDEEIYKLLEQIKKEGCGYVAIVNTLFYEFPGTEEEFEKIYGFPMKNENGEYNYDKMLIELYCMTDDKYFISDDRGVLALWSDYSDCREEFEQIYGVAWDSSNNEIKEAILKKHNSNVVYKKTNGLNRYEVDASLRTYLEHKAVAADIDTVKISTIDEVKEHITQGKVVQYLMGEGAVLDNGEEKYVIEGDNHWVTITNVTEDGKYEVSSYGKKWYVDPKQISEKNNEDISLGYISIDINYKIKQL